MRVHVCVHVCAHGLFGGMLLIHRRYKKLQHLLEEGSFFSEEAMKERCPWLYDQFVGQYLTDREIAAQVRAMTQSWSDQLLAHAASKRVS